MTKVDQNGTTHTYSFDLLGRMTADAVTLASGNPQNVDSSVLRIETSYNTQGLVDTITTFDATSGGNITSQVQNVYNGLGQLTSQFQEHAGAVNTSTSLHVDYGYSDLAHGSRLTSLTYPNGRVLTYHYGTSSSLDDSISRLTSISDGNTTLESYAYLGLGTVVERDHPESGANLTYIKLTGESDGTPAINPAPPASPRPPRGNRISYQRCPVLHYVPVNEARQWLNFDQCPVQPCSLSCRCFLPYSCS